MIWIDGATATILSLDRTGRSIRAASQKHKHRAPERNRQKKSENTVEKKDTRDTAATEKDGKARARAAIRARKAIQQTSPVFGGSRSDAKSHMHLSRAGFALRRRGETRRLSTRLEGEEASIEPNAAIIIVRLAQDGRGSKRFAKRMRPRSLRFATCSGFRGWCITKRHAVVGSRPTRSPDVAVAKIFSSEGKGTRGSVSSACEARHEQLMSVCSILNAVACLEPFFFAACGE